MNDTDALTLGGGAGQIGQPGPPSIQHHHYDEDDEYGRENIHGAAKQLPFWGNDRVRSGILLRGRRSRSRCCLERRTQILPSVILRMISVK